MISLSEIARLNNKAAVERLLRKRFDNDADQLVSAMNAGLYPLLRSDLRKAGRFVDYAKKCYAHLPNKCLPRLLSLEARYRHWCGDYAAALHKYLRAEELFRKQRDFAALAGLRRGLIDVYMYMGRYQDSLRVGTKSLNYFRRKGRLTDAAEVMTNIGNVYHRMDNNRAALHCYDKARTAFEKEDSASLAIVDYNRANIYVNLNDLKRAEALYLTAAEIYRKSGLEIALSQSEYSLAYVYFLQDRYAEALQMLEKVRESFSRLGDIKSAAVTQLDLVEIDLHLNQYGSAIMLGEKIVLALRKLGLRYEEAKAHYFIALARLKLGDLAQAATQLKRAETLFEREKNGLWLGMVHLGRGRLFMARGQHAKAVQACLTAETHYRRCGDQRRMLDTRIVYAEAILNSGDTKAALSIARRLTKRKLISYQKLALYDLLGRIYKQMESIPEALKHFKKAVALLEKMLAGLYPDEIRFFFVADKYDIYMRAVDCLLDMKKIDDSFVNNLRALATINQRSGALRRIEKRVPRNLLDARDSLRVSLKKLHKLPRSGQRIAGSQSSYLQTEQKLWSNERKIRAFMYPQLSSGQSGKESHNDPAIVLEKFVRSDETIINFYTFGGAVGAFCATTEQTTFHPLSITFDELSVLIRKLHFVCENSIYSSRDEHGNRAVVQALLADLFRSLVEPLLSHVKTRRLLFITDHEFAQIPFPALSGSNKTPLKDLYQIRLLVNPLDLTARDRPLRIERKSANAILAVTSPTLPAIETEACAIGRIFGNSRIYVDQAATARALLTELNKKNGFVHIATHASRSSENPLFSRILMHDGPLFPFDLLGTGINSTLVTLSGCQTAAPGLYYGNSFSLAKAFYQAGSRFVLASLWPVSDRLSMIFMTEFYQALLDTQDVFISYHRAVNKLEELTANPAFWSGFVLLGI